MVIWEGQHFGICLHVVNIVDQPTIAQFITPDFQHSVVNVCQRDPPGRPNQARELGGQITGATGNIQDFVPRSCICTVNGVALPQTVNAHRHQVIHDVVFCRHRVKHIGHQRGFLLFVDLLKAKVGL